MIVLLQTFNLIWIILKKYFIAEGSPGSNGWHQVNNERTYSREPLLRTIFFDSRHLQIARGRPTWNENIWTLTMPNGKSQSSPPQSVKWVVAQTCKACKLAFYNIKRSRMLGLIPSAGIATADTWFKCFCTNTFPRKHVLVLVDLSTLGIPQTDSVWMSKRQLKKTHCDLYPQ